MTISRKTLFQSEIPDPNANISEGSLEYLRQRLRNNLYDFVVSKFLEQQEKGLTQARLADRIKCDPGRLSKLLGAPGNWTIGTISDLLAGISGEELVANSHSILGRPRNYEIADWVHMDPQSGSTTTTASAETDSFSDFSAPQNDKANLTTGTALLYTTKELTP